MARKVRAAVPLFNHIEAIQVLELSTIVNGPLGGNLPTTLELSFGVNVVERADRDSDVIVVPFNFKVAAGTLESEKGPTLEAKCRLVGFWRIPKGVNPKPEELKSMAEEHAVGMLYLLARQHLGDVMSKVGARVDAWAWQPPGVLFEPMGRAPGGKEEKTTKSKKRTARG